MKTKLKKIIILGLVSLPMISRAQFLTNPPFFNYIRTDYPATMQKVGVGNFPNNASVQAKLHINQFLLVNNPATNGLMFRTDGINNTDNIWSIYTGTNNNTLTEKFRLYVAANSTNTVLQTQQGNSRMLFNTNGAINRMLIVDGNTASASGRIAMGNNLPINFTPLSRLHLHQTNFVNTIRFTTDNMINGIGFEVGYDATSNVQNQQYAEIHNRENTPIKFFTTGNNQRMHINQSKQSSIGTYNAIPTPGYVGIGRNTGNIWGTNAAVGRGPYSLLHLNNDLGSPEQQGYRPWMRGGISFTENVDFGYVGMRPFFDNSGNFDNSNIIENRNEFVVAWSNNPNTGSIGSDDLCFRFTSNVDGFANSINTGDLFSPSDLDGRHIARFTALGNMGLGPTFGEENPVYVAPQSLLHMSRDQQKDTWLQITNQTGTGQTIVDGLRVGITTTGTAHIKQQEMLPLVLYTGAVEDVRIVPASASTLAGNHGMVGIGNFSLDTLDAKLDIDGDLRIRTVTQRDTLLQVLVIDSNDHNRVHWRSIGNLGGGGVGNYCSASQNPLTGNYEIPLNNFNYYFTDPIDTLNHGENFVKIGDDCTTPINAKLEVHRGITTNTQFNNIGALVVNEDNATNTFNWGFGHGIFGNATGPNEQNSGVSGTSSNASTNYGGFFSSFTPFLGGSQNQNNIGVSGRGSNGFHNIGGQFQSFSNGISDYNRGVESTAFGSDVENTGGYFVSSGSSTSSVNYGIYSAASGGNITRAGFFNGDVEIINGMLVSDKKFKTDINDIKGATDVLRKLKPSTFKMDITGFPQFNFQDRKQYGFIAQEVESVLPDLVHDSYMPAELDSLGNEVYPAVNYKSLNCNAIIPITVQAVNEITERIDKSTLSDQNVKTNVQTLASSLDKVKQMRGVSYEWSNDAQNNMNLDSLQHIGFIAQEVAAIE
ncbi:MAG: tail fiber domain-containing protein, partial [Flavobacteriales bacterium]|nr:tail fiber domain-containing protein [Flavobacteriales bacterium]